jgi:hypothetical protein
MKQNDGVNENRKIATDKTLATKGVRKIPTGSNAIFKQAEEPPTECNPDNGAFFEERSNPLSSKGN